MFGILHMIPKVFYSLLGENSYEWGMLSQSVKYFEGCHLFHINSKMTLGSQPILRYQL